MENKELYDKYADGSPDYDKNHALFRTIEFIKFMELRRREFMNSFRFEGDEEFTIAKQRMLLKHTFNYGYAGIVSVAKSILKEEDYSTVTEALADVGVSVDEVVEKELGDKIPVAILPYEWDTSERPVASNGVTAGMHNIGRKTYKCDTTNSAVLMFDSNHKSGMWLWLAPAYMYATASTVLKKRLTLVDATIISNAVNNDVNDKRYENIYDVNKSFVSMSPAQTSISGNKPEAINVAAMLDTKLKKLDMSNGETINDLIDFVNAYENRILSIHGVRTNINQGKQERSITMDFESMEVQWRRLENEVKDQLEMFVEEYKRVFGKQLTVISLVDEVIKEMRDLQQQNMNGGNNNADTEKSNE